ILTTAHTPMQERLLSLYNDLMKLIKIYQPQQIAIEQLFFGKNVTTGISVAQARGVMLLAAAQLSLPIREYKPIACGGCARVNSQYQHGYCASNAAIAASDRLRLEDTF
ncbi:MAG: crossover junction endodeoxyribonuclease RuvC, partial [Anaerolineae bacterium]|nr:crossover junction endodeoxyribonuclease RuvC [Anaerolineae bacterium]